MKDRVETKRRLDRISEMSDEEITINAEWIRETARAAIMHINSLQKSNQDKKNRFRQTSK